MDCQLKPYYSIILYMIYILYCFLIFEKCYILKQVLALGLWERGHGPFYRTVFTYRTHLISLL